MNLFREGDIVRIKKWEDVSTVLYEACKKYCGMSAVVIKPDHIDVVSDGRNPVRVSFNNGLVRIRLNDGLFADISSCLLEFVYDEIIEPATYDDIKEFYKCFIK